MQRSIRENILIILLLFIAVIVCYGNMIDSNFVWDDDFIVVQNSLLRAPLWSFQMFKQDIVNSGFTHTLYYRPVQILSYALDYRIGGLDPAVFHSVSVFMHFLNCVLVFILILLLSGNKPMSLLGSLLFAIHPAHSGAVSYISGRAELLFFFFGFMSLVTYVLFRKKGKDGFMAASLVFFGLSVLSKEAGLIFAVILVLLEWSFFSGDLRKRVTYIVSYFILTLCYFGIHYFVLGPRYGEILGTNGAGILENISASFGFINEYLILCIFPAGLHMRQTIGGAGRFFLPVVLIYLGIALIFVAVKKERRSFMFSLSFFVIALIPFLLVAGSFGVLAEHWMYLASFGLLFFGAAAIIGLYERYRLLERTLLIILVLCGIIFYSKMTRAQNLFWSDNEVLSERVLSYSAADPAAMQYKTIAFFQKGKKHSALGMSEDATVYRPTSPRAWYLKGRLSLASDNIEQAEKDFNKALGLKKDYSNAYVGLAMTAFKNKQNEKGIEYLKYALTLSPGHPEALFLLGVSYSKSGQTRKALEAAQQAYQADPYGYRALIDLGTAYARLGYPAEGADFYLQAAALYPEEPLSYYNLGYLFFAAGQPEEAGTWTKKAIMADSTFKPAIDLYHEINQHKRVRSSHLTKPNEIDNSTRGSGLHI